MAKLKEVRIMAGLRQCHVAEKIGKLTYEISNYENAVSMPDLENMVILEKELTNGQAIDWQDPQTIKEKREIVQSLIILMERFPVEAVLSFGIRAMKEGKKTGDPGILIQHYAKVSADNDPDHLLPGDVVVDPE